jgi:tRNA A37 threonylcarbamoyladenosine synthetase subunit TsaC/SUA5/YrdC
MTRPDIKADAQRVFDVLKAGGAAICPADVGYAIMTCNPKALEKIFMTKQRGAHKRHAMIGSYAVHKDVHVMEPQHQEIVDHLVNDLDLPLGIIARFKADHPMIKNIDAVTMEASTVGGAISILTNAGAFQDELTRLTLAANLPILGSSANLSGTGE